MARRGLEGSQKSAQLFWESGKSKNTHPLDSGTHHYHNGVSKIIQHGLQISFPRIHGSMTDIVCEAKRVY
jgi:hypothetical protein